MDSSDSLSVSLTRTVEAFYGNNPWVRGLAQLLPLGSVADSLISTALTNAQRQNQRIFFEELGSIGVALTEEQINDNDFLHAYFATARAASRTRHEKKVRLFAHLFATHIQDTSLDAGDKYEDFLQILDDLTFREIQVLLVLHRFEVDTVVPPIPLYSPPPPENFRPATLPPTHRPATDLERNMSFWEAFIKTVESHVGISSSDLPGFLLRLSRTGLYKNVTGAKVGNNEVGILTPNFYVFMEALGKISLD